MHECVCVCVWLQQKCETGYVWLPSLINGPRADEHAAPLPCGSVGAFSHTQCKYCSTFDGDVFKTTVRVKLEVTSLCSVFC